MTTTDRPVCRFCDTHIYERPQWKRGRAGETTHWHKDCYAKWRSYLTWATEYSKQVSSG